MGNDFDGTRSKNDTSPGSFNQGSDHLMLGTMQELSEMQLQPPKSYGLKR